MKDKANTLGRRRTRAAAMVEAAVVVPVLVCFLGLGTMMFRGYQTKIEANQAVRSAALDYAAHDCEHAPSTLGSRNGSVTKSGTSLVAPRHVDGNGASEGLQDRMAETSPALRGAAGFAEASYPEQVIANPFPSRATDGRGLSLRVRGERSVTLCNEPPMEGGLVSMAKTIGTEVSKAAGSSANSEGGRSDFRNRD